MARDWDEKHVKKDILLLTSNGPGGSGVALLGICASLSEVRTGICRAGGILCQMGEEKMCSVSEKVT